MDLPTCPHCGQSVLDDDIDDCPFCGESMSAPAVKKKPAAPQSVAKAPAKAETQSAPKPPAKAKPKSKPAKPAASSDEPFAVDHAALTNAVPLRPKPSPGRTFKVVCPMCETAGYTSPKAGGREVKCANPKCLVPVFTCPEPPPAPVEAAPAESGLSTTMLSLIGVAAIAAVGLGVWFFILKDDAPEPGPNPNLAGPASIPAPENDAQPTETVGTPQQPPVQPVNQGPDLSELRRQAAERMVAVSEQPRGRGPARPRPLMVEWTALSFAELGKLDEAKQQLDRLSAYSDDAPHYRVLPWVEIGWQQREREESPAEAVENALKFAESRPPSLHSSWLQAVALGALLVANGRADDVPAVLNRDLGRPDAQELWLDSMAVILDGSFDLEAWESARRLILPKNPAGAGIVWQLVFHNAEAEALKWAQGQSDPQTRAESLIAWSEALTARQIARKQPANLEGLAAALDSLPENWRASATARAYARIGQRRLMAGDSAAAESMLQKAQEALAKLPQREPMAVPDMKALHNGNFPRRQAATDQEAAAAFETARLLATRNHLDDAWIAVEKGLAALRSESIPQGTAGIFEPLRNADVLRSQLRSTLSLRSEDEARQAFRTYLKNVNEMKRQAEDRLKLQADLLASAARWNLADRVRQEIANQPSEGDRYFETELPWVALAELKNQNPELAKSLETALKEKRRSKPKGRALREDSAQWMASGNIPKVVEGLVRDRKSLSDSDRRRWILRLASREVVKGRIDNVLAFLTGLYNADPFLGEDAGELLTGLATRIGHGQTVWNELRQRDWPPTLKLAGYRGFMGASAPKSEPAAEPSAQ